MNRRRNILNAQIDELYHVLIKDENDPQKIALYTTIHDKRFISSNIIKLKKVVNELIAEKERKKFDQNAKLTKPKKEKTVKRTPKNGGLNVDSCKK